MKIIILSKFSGNWVKIVPGVKCCSSQCFLLGILGDIGWKVWDLVNFINFIKFHPFSSFYLFLLKFTFPHFPRFLVFRGGGRSPPHTSSEDSFSDRLPVQRGGGCVRRRVPKLSREGLRTPPLQFFHRVDVFRTGRMPKHKGSPFYVEHRSEKTLAVRKNV